MTEQLPSGDHSIAASIATSVDRQLSALADPTRRAVYDIVRAEPSSVSAVASQLPVSQPAVSQHLRVLTEARLVTATPSGARRIYRADPAGIASLRTWIDHLWEDVLDSFVDAAAELKATDLEPKPQAIGEPAAVSEMETMTEERKDQP